MKRKPMISRTAVVGAAAGVTAGFVACIVLRERRTEDVLDVVDRLVGQTRETAGDIARTIRDKATPLAQIVGDLVERNADVVSSLTDLSVDRVRSTGQGLRQAASAIDKSLEPLARLTLAP
jgi:gas vesicle protein